jgi:hypothetical protein
MRSGVEAPEGKAGDGGARFDVEWEAVVIGETVEWVDVAGESVDERVPRVVLRVMFVVSEEGGAGRWDNGRRVEEERMEARHRKHSPVPK